MDVEPVRPFHNAMLSVEHFPGHPSPWHGSHTPGHDPINIIDIASVYYGVPHMTIIFFNSYRGLIKYSHPG